MKKITLTICLTAFVSLCFAQTNLFFDDFESYADFAIDNVGDWTLIDVDQLNTYGFTGVTFPETGAAKSFQVFNSTQTVAPLDPTATSDWTGFNSIKGMVCFAAVPAGGVSNDDWLISPSIQLAASGNTLSFRYKACDANFSVEEFTVGVSTTDTDPSSFTIVSANPESVPANDITWREFTIDLSTYDNQAVFIGIHCVSNDQFGFMVDDFSVDTDLNLNLDVFAQNSFSKSYRNSTKELHLSSSQFNLSKVEIFNVLGQEAMTQNLDSNEEIVNLSSLTDGVYLVRVSIENSSKTFKIVKN